MMYGYCIKSDNNELLIDAKEKKNEFLHSTTNNSYGHTNNHLIVAFQRCKKKQRETLFYTIKNINYQGVQPVDQYSNTWMK